MPKKMEIYGLAEQLGQLLRKRKMQCAVAESCTGGSLAAAITDVPGSSQWFDRGFVTYTNRAKEEMLGVSADLIALHGAVSGETACAMAHGAMVTSDAEISVAITGIAGPGGGTTEKPVGTVWIAWAGDKQETYRQCFHFRGNREAIRQQAVLKALQGLTSRCDPKTHPYLQQVTSERYFFALWPDNKTALILYQQAQLLLGTTECKPTLEENLHLTLVYLGTAHPDFIQHAMEIASRLHVNAFELCVNRAHCWSQNKVCCLGVEKMPLALEQLTDALNQELIIAGFKPERRQFIPHVTIARHYSEKNILETTTPIAWSIHDFCLVKSNSVSGLSDYEIIARWPLSHSI